MLLGVHTFPIRKNELTILFNGFPLFSGPNYSAVKRNILYSNCCRQDLSKFTKRTSKEPTSLDITISFPLFVVIITLQFSLLFLLILAANELAGILRSLE